MRHDYIFLLLKAIFIEAVSIALMLMGHIIADGTYSDLSFFLFTLGWILVLVGIIIGIRAFISAKKDR